MSERHYKVAYGDTAKTPANLTRCCEEVVRYIGNWPHYGQCARKRGYGPDEAYCKQHAPEVAAKRKAEVEDRQAVAYRKQRMEWAGPRFYAVLKQIADGHNDPRTIASEAIQSFTREYE